MSNFVPKERLFCLKPLVLACLVATTASSYANTSVPSNADSQPTTASSSASRWWLPRPNTNATYVAPVADHQLTKPDYTRRINPTLANSQPRGSSGTRTGYSAMDSAYNTNLTERFYGANEDGYANRLLALKNTIDTRQMSVGVIDTGINRNNRDMVGANVHSTQIRCHTAGSNNCYLPNNDTGIVEVPTTFASGDHGNQMAAIVAGNNGMTNARIYGSDSIDRASNGGNQFLMMRKLNQDHNVKIFNNSWGSNNTDRWYHDAQRSNYNPTTGNVTYNRYNITNADITLPVIHDLILNRDALIIKATGNENQNDAHDENLAPLINGQFKKGFITVSSPREDFSAANYCGRTAEWCVSATSTTQNYANNGRLSTYQGTSPATARVTGTAVLVKAAYPWMRNENIAQTILGTAKDFDDIARNSPSYQGLVRVSRLPAGYRGNYFTDNRGNYYITGNLPWQNRQIVRNHHGKNLTWEGGWGLLDPEAASKGYGGFYWDNVVLDTQGTPVSVFYNDLKGDKGFTKAGDGKLVFMGNNRYLGDSIIAGGALEVNGHNGSSHIRVNGGELTGYGTVSNVSQTAGWVNNEGNLTIDGDYNTNINKGVNAGFKARFGNMLTVNGKARLSGMLNLTGETNDGIISQKGSRSTVLRANQGVDGNFEQHYSSNPLFEVTNVDYTPKTDNHGQSLGGSTKHDVQVTAKRLRASNVVRSVSMTDSGHLVAQNLDKVLEDLDKKQETDKLSDGELRFAKQVFVGFDGMASNGGTLSKTDTNRELYRLDPTVYANNAINSLDVSADQGTEFGRRLAQLNQNTLWGDVRHQNYRYNLSHATSERRGTNYSVGVGGMLGKTSVGAELDVGTSSLTDSVYGISNKATTKTVGLTVGAKKDLNGYALSGWVKGATSSTESERHSTNKKGNFDGTLYGVGVQLGKTLTINPQLTATPYAFANHHTYAYRGNVDDGINTLNRITANQQKIGVGADVTYRPTDNWEVFGGAKLTNTVSKDVKLDTHYTGTATAVSFEDWNTDKTKWSAKIGTTYHLTPNSQIGLSYDYSKGSHDSTGRVGLSVASKF